LKASEKGRPTTKGREQLVYINIGNLVFPVCLHKNYVPSLAR